MNSACNKRYNAADSHTRTQIYTEREINTMCECLETDQKPREWGKYTLEQEQNETFLYEDEWMWIRNA